MLIDLNVVSLSADSDTRGAISRSFSLSQNVNTTHLQRLLRTLWNSYRLTCHPRSCYQILSVRLYAPQSATIGGIINGHTPDCRSSEEPPTIKTCCKQHARDFRYYPDEACVNFHLVKHAPPPLPTTASQFTGKWRVLRRQLYTTSLLRART